MVQIKCDRYWPSDGEPLFYGDLQVKIMSENVTGDWHVRDMHISLVCVCTPMGVNATGTLRGSQVERRRRENLGAVGGEGVEFGEGQCPFTEYL